MTRDRAVIVDIDGTLALRGDRGPFDWARVGEDQPNPPVIELVNMIWNADTHTVILMSGRDEVCRNQTEMWLSAQINNWHHLYMRPARDNRKDAIVKEELYRTHVEPHYRVSFVIDDRDQVVAMWRRIGLPCFQVAEGAF